MIESWQPQIALCYSGSRSTPKADGHFPAIATDSLPKFLRALYANEACMGVATRIATRLMMLTFVRTSELIETSWSEVDLEREEWDMPWQRMTRGRRRRKPYTRNHDLCAATQVFALLRELKQYKGGAPLMFPNVRDRSRPMSNMALLKAIERMGYKGDMTGRGLRALAMSTLKERLHFRHEVVDRELSHALRDELEEVYDRAPAQGVVEQVTQRRHGQCSRHREHPGGAAIGDHNTLLQSWSDLLDGCARNGRDSPVMAGFQSEAMMPPGVGAFAQHATRVCL
jgi:integrase